MAPTTPVVQPGFISRGLPPPSAAPGTDPTAALATNLDATVQAAPELSKSPGAAVDVATAGGNIPQNAQAVAQAGVRSENQAAIGSADQQSGGIVHNVFNWLGHAASKVGTAAMKDLSAPVSFVQHEYRYLHDVEARHGMFAAIAEGAAVAAGVAAGTILTGGIGDAAVAGVLGLGEGVAEDAAVTAGSDLVAGASEDLASSGARSVLGRVAGAGKSLLRGGIGRGTQVLGGETAVAGMGQVLYRDSWNRTAASTYTDPNTGQQVSVGRDLASGIFHLSPKSSTYHVLSGTTDALADVFGDPVANGLNAVTAARGVEGLGGVLGGRFQGTNLARIINPQDVEKMLSGSFDGLGGFRRAVQSLADAKDVDSVLRQNPLYGPFADQLAKANTPDDVVDVFRQKANVQQFLSNQLPALSITKAKFGELRSAMDNAGDNHLGRNLNPANWAARVSRKLTRIPGQVLDPDLNNLKGTLDPVDRGWSQAPDTIDPATGAVVPGEVTRARTLHGLVDFRLMLRYALQPDEVKDILEQYVAADPIGRVTIFRNALLAVVLRHEGREFDLADPMAALKSDQELKFKQHLKGFLDGELNQFFPESNSAYGGMLDGGGAPNVIGENGQHLGAAVMLGQKGQIVIPTLGKIKEMGQALTQARHWVGGADDFMYDHLTSKWKGLVLMSGGYPLHISGAEIVPNGLRVGFARMLVNGVHATEAHLGAQIANEDATMGGVVGLSNKILGKVGLGARDASDGSAKLGAIMQRVYHLVQKLPKDQETMNEAVKFNELTNAHGLTPAENSGYIAAEQNKATVIKNEMGKGRRFVPDPKAWTLYDRSAGDTQLDSWHNWSFASAKDPLKRAAANEFHRAYAAGASEEVATGDAKDAALRAIHAMTPDERSLFMRSRYKSVGSAPGTSPLEDWANVVAADVKGLTHSPTTHAPDMARLDQLRKGQTPSLVQLKRVPLEHRPVSTPGRVMIPDTTSGLDRFVNSGMRNVMNPIVNGLSRRPLAFTEFQTSYRALKPFVDAGMMTEDERAVQAVSKSTVNVVKNVHNLHDRTQLDEMLRNWVPFFFAQEQAYRRAGRLLAQDPAAFRRYQLAIVGVANYAAKLNSGAGSSYIAFPGSGLIADGTLKALSLAGIPMGSLVSAGFGGTTSAMNVVFPLSAGPRPNFGPVAIVPAQMVNGLFAEFGHTYGTFAPVSKAMTDTFTYALGQTAMSEPILQQLIPNQTVYRIVETATANDTSFNSAFMDAAQQLAYQQNLATAQWEKDGSKGPAPQIVPPPTASPLELQDFVNKLKNQTRVLFALRAIIGSVSPVSSDVMIGNYGIPQELQNEINANGGSYTKGVQAFLAKNPYASPFLTAHSQTVTGSAIPESKGAEDWINANWSLIQSNPNAAMWLMPQLKDTTYNAQVYLEQIAQGLRTRDTPIEFINQLYTTAGDTVFYNALAQHEAALQSAGTDAGAVQAEYAKWTAYTGMLQQQMPVWASNFDMNNRLIQGMKGLNELNTLFQAGQQGTGEQSQLVGQLLQIYNDALAKYQQAGTQSNYSSAQSLVRKQYEANVVAMGQEYPQLAPVVSAVFRDALSSTAQSLGA